MKVKSESEVAQPCPTLATPRTAAYQAPPSMGFSRQKYWSGVPLPSPAPWLYVVANGNLLPRGLMPPAECPRSATARAPVRVAGQEMARVNTDILGISELKWTRMGIFNSDDQYIYYHGQECLRRNGVALTVNKRVQNAGLGCNLKNDRMIFVCLQNKPFSITVIQVYASTINAEEAEVEQFYEDHKTL